MSDKLPAQARVLIIGGGIIGAAIAYHAARGGCADVVLCERRELTCGTTWHAAGLVGKLRGDPTIMALAKYSADLYATLAQDTGVQTGLKLPGALNIADSEGLLTEYRRLASLGQRFGLAAELLTPDDIAARCPLLNTDGLLGGVFLPDDGQADPVGTTQALARAARQHGARIVENCKITALRREGDRITGAHTTLGDIGADTVVLAAGLWSRDLAAAAGISVPLAACEHYYIVTEPVPDLPPDLPVIRDVGSRAYYKGDAGKILLGCFEEHARPWGLDGVPDDFCFDQLPGEFSHFEPILEKAMQRLPLLQTAGIQTFFCGPESFTPDNRPLLGPAPEAPNLFIAAGLNSIGIQTAGGIGRAIWQWIERGVPPYDLGRADIARAMPFSRNRRYLRCRAEESLGLLYSVHWPYKQPTTARGARRSPLHQHLQNANACFGEAAGWERPNWFAAPDAAPQYQYAFGRQNWFAACAQECAAADHAALCDLSSFAKFRVQGADSTTFLNRICAANVDVAIGKIVYTPWLNHAGGFEADLTVTRLGEDDFLILSGVMSQRRDAAWLARHLQDGERVHITDVTSAYANIGLFGEHAATILAAAGAGDDARMPYGAARQTEAGYALVTALRIGYAGCAGYELLVPSEFAAGVYETLLQEGAARDIRPIGFHAIDSMRMEKARRHFGDDITTADTPLQAGLGFALAWDKPGGFIGRDALLPQRDAPKSGKLAKRLLQFALAAGADAPLMFGDEPLLRDGKVVGGITSAAYGHRVQQSLALAYAHHPDGASRDWCDSGKWEIEIAGQRHAATWLPRMPHDPDNANLHQGF